MVDPYNLQDCERWADYFLGSQDHGQTLQNVLRFVQRYAAGYRPGGAAGGRKSTILHAVKHARGLSRILGQIELRALADAMGNGQAEPLPLAPLRLVQLVAFIETLADVAAGLEIAAGQEPLRASRPVTDDPIVFAVEALAALWVRTHGTRPTLSYKARGFGALALTVLGPQRLGYAEATIRGAVRQVLDRARSGS